MSAELHQQKMQAQLDEWKAEFDKLKAKVSGANADVQLKWKEQLQLLEVHLEEGKAKLAALKVASDERRAALKAEVESTWESLKSKLADAKANLKG